MEDDINLVWYALLSMIGLFLIANAGFIIATIYEAAPMPKRCSKTLKDTILFRNSFLQFLAACNVLRAFTLFLIGVARGSQSGKVYSKFYAGAELFKDALNMVFAAIFTMITLFFIKLYRTRASPGLFRFAMIIIGLSLVGYVIIGTIIVLTVPDIASYEWANSFIFIAIFLLLLLIILYYGLGLIFQVREIEQRKIRDLILSSEGKPVEGSTMTSLTVRLVLMLGVIVYGFLGRVIFHVLILVHVMDIYTTDSIDTLYYFFLELVPSFVIVLLITKGSAFSKKTPTGGEMLATRSRTPSEVDESEPRLPPEMVASFVPEKTAIN